MRALLITHDFLPCLTGGISTYYHHLCRQLGDAISVLAPGCDAAPAFDAEQPYRVHRRWIPTVSTSMMKVDRVPFLRWPRAAGLAALQSLLYDRHGRRIVRSEGTDVVLLGHLYLAPLGRWLRRATAARYGVFLHGSELHRYIRWPPVRRLMIGALAAADLTIVNSEFTRRQYLERGVPEDSPFVKVSPGVDTRRFRPDAGDPDAVRRRLRLGGRRVIASVARLVPWKGQDTLLRALPAIRGSVPDAACLLVGAGPYRAELERLVRELDLADHVRFAGYVPEEQLPAYYRAADVVAVPTRAAAPGMPMEGFGIVFAEAAACGVPAIGTDIGGTGESIEDGVTGLRVPPDDPEALADAAVRLLRDTGLARRMGRAGRERAVRELDWSAAGDRLRAALEGIATGRDPSARPEPGSPDPGRSSGQGPFSGTSPASGPDSTGSGSSSGPGTAAHPDSSA